MKECGPMPFLSVTGWSRFLLQNIDEVLPVQWLTESNTLFSFCSEKYITHSSIPELEKTRPYILQRLQSYTESDLLCRIGVTVHTRDAALRHFAPISDLIVKCLPLSIFFSLSLWTENLKILHSQSCSMKVKSWLQR